MNPDATHDDAIRDIAEMLAPIYADQGWWWVSASADDDIPNAFEIEAMIRRLLGTASHYAAQEGAEEPIISGCGRLTVTISEGCATVSLELGHLYDDGIAAAL